MTMDERKDKRVLAALKVRYKSATVGEFISKHSHDIGPGGVFIRAKKPLAKGTLLKLDFRLDDDTPVIQGVGRVVWTRTQAAAADKPPGMGIKFIRLDDNSAENIEKIIAAQRSGKALTRDSIAPAPVKPSAPLGYAPSDDTTAGQPDDQADSWQESREPERDADSEEKAAADVAEERTEDAVQEGASEADGRSVGQEDSGAAEIPEGDGGAGDDVGEVTAKINLNDERAAVVQNGSDQRRAPFAALIAAAVAGAAVVGLVLWLAGRPAPRGAAPEGEAARARVDTGASATASSAAAADRSADTIPDTASAPVAVDTGPALSGAVTIETTPPGARVLLNGADAGQATPVHLDALPAGKTVEITAQLVGFRPERRTVTPQEGQPLTVQMTLTPAPVQLTVESEPAGARVRVDGHWRGRTPLTVSKRVPPDAEVELVLAGHAPAVVTLTPDMWRWEDDAYRAVVRAALQPQETPSKRPDRAEPAPRRARAKKGEAPAAAQAEAPEQPAGAAQPKEPDTGAKGEDTPEKAPAAPAAQPAPQPAPAPEPEPAPKAQPAPQPSPAPETPAPSDRSENDASAPVDNPY